MNSLTLLTLLLTVLQPVPKSCQDQTEANPSYIDGHWSLIEYIPSAILPSPQVFSKGAIVWSFDSEAREMTVSVHESIQVNILAEGSYPYTFGDDGCNDNGNQFIIIGERGFGTLILDEVSNNKLTITMACKDGHVLVFHKMD